MIQKNLYMESWEGRFEEMGSHTLEVSILGRRVILTDDPENIKAVLATQFHDYGSFLSNISPSGISGC